MFISFIKLLKSCKDLTQKFHEICNEIRRGAAGGLVDQSNVE